MLVFSAGPELYSDSTGDLTACRLPPVDVTATCLLKALKTDRFKAAKLGSGFQV